MLDTGSKVNRPQLTNSEIEAGKVQLQVDGLAGPLSLPTRPAWTRPST